MNLGSGFLFIWLPSMTLFAILLKLVAKGSNYGRVALNIVLPTALLFLGFNLLQTVDSMLPQTLLRFLFMVSLFWLPLFIVLICVNHQSAAVWFDPALSSLNSRPKLGLNLKEVILGLLFAAVWAFMLGVLMMSATAIFRPFLIIIGNFIKNPSSQTFYANLFFYSMAAGCLTVLLAGFPGGLYVAAEDEVRKALYRKYFWMMICWGLVGMAPTVLWFFSS